MATRITSARKEPVLVPPADDPIASAWAIPQGILGRLRTNQNNIVGGRMILTAFILFIVGGINALLMRTQLAVPENTFLSPQSYNQFFTMHGSTMMFLFAVPIMEGIAIILLPFMLGNREMPFPRLGVFSFFTFLFGSLLFYSSFLFGEVPDTGWFAYTPLSGPEYSAGRGMDFWLLALSVAEVAAISAGVEIIIAILWTRAPGMSISRMPLYAWAMLVFAFMLLFAFVPLIVGSAMLELDRQLGTQLFDPDAGGSPILWQHLFWIFGHPEVYLQFIPAVGMVSMIIPVFARRRIAGYTFMAAALLATGFISFGLWVHHMFTVGLPQGAMIFFAAASMIIAIPSGVQVFSWITTLWRGRPVWRTPLLFVVGFIVLFVLGGVTGVMLGSPPFDWQVHDTYFVVAHFHYVLIGGVTFPLFAALYYWMPQFTGKLLNERLGKWHFWLFFIGFNVTFFPMHIVGLLGMPRRVYTYSAGYGWDIFNLISTLGAFLIAISVGVFAVNFIQSLRRPNADPNPWGADSLEWSTTTPAPNYGFSQLPIVHSRHPLWDQERLDQGDARTVSLVQRLARWPDQWRAVLVTSMLDARPVEVFRVAGPSLWPFITAIGMVTIFGAEIFGLHLLALIGIAIVVIGVVGWNWPERIASPTKEEEDFEREHGIAVRPHGSTVVTRWAMGLSILIAGIALASLVFSYFYLRLENDSWPIGDLPLPDLILPAVGAVALLSGVAASYWALRGIRRDNRRQLRIGLAVGFIAGLIAFGLMVYAYSQLPFDWRVNAYGSLVYLLGGFTLLIVLAGLGMNVFTQFWASRSAYTAREHVAVSNTVLFWLAMAATWIIAFGVLTLTPHLT